MPKHAKSSETEAEDLPWATDEVMRAQSNHNVQFQVQFNSEMARSVRQAIGFLDIEDPTPADTQQP